MRIQEALGRIESRLMLAQARDIGESEFRVFSQWGEDGILQYLINNVEISQKVFVEFGVENYLESNTRFLLTNDHWSGLIMDGSKENIDYIRKDPIYWASNLKAEHLFITKDNINHAISSNGIIGDIGILSIDIDGNDYWVWDSINTIIPSIVVCEYNSHFGPHAKVTVPYDDQFTRGRAHFSKIYYGASISALATLGATKGYALVGSNSAGNNAFFIKKERLGNIKPIDPIKAYRRAQFREFHNQAGDLTFDDFEMRLEGIADMPLYDIESHKLVSVGELGLGIDPQTKSSGVAFK